MIPRKLAIPCWRRADDPPEMARELRLIVETQQRGQIRREDAVSKQMLCTGDAQVCQILVRGQAHLCTKHTAQMEFIEPGMVRKVVERDRVAKPLAEVLQRAPDGT